MKRLGPFTRYTANYYHKNGNDTTAVWLPNRLYDGLLRVRATSDQLPKPHEPLGWITELKKFQDTPGLRQVLGQLGISAKVAGRDGEAMFPHPVAIASRLAHLNTLLPADHSLPRARMLPDDVTSRGILYTQMAKNDYVVLPRVTGLERKSDTALAVAHDIIARFPARLTMDPQSREVLADQAEGVLDMIQRSDNRGKSPCDNYIEALEENVLPPVVSAEKFDPDDTRSPSYTPGIADALYTISNEAPGGERLDPAACIRLGRLSIDHLQFLQSELSKTRIFYI